MTASFREKLLKCAQNYIIALFKVLWEIDASKIEVFLKNILSPLCIFMGDETLPT